MIWFMTGGPFVAERIVRQFWSGYDAWAKQYVSPRNRLAIGAGAAVIGMFVANFLAFNDERSLYLSEQTQLDRASEKQERVYLNWGDQKFKAITDALKPLLAAGDSSPVGVANNASSTALGKRFSAFFRSQNVNSYIMYEPPESVSDEGIYVYIRNSDHPSPADQKVLDAFRLQNIPVTPRDLLGNGPQPSNEPFQLEISFPPL